MSFQTEQEEFWAGDFGDKYILRNQSDAYLASNLNFFSDAMRKIVKPENVIEFGANIGMNLMAVKMLFPDILVSAIEINHKATTELSKSLPEIEIFNQSIYEFQTDKQYDITLIKGVLIHIPPEKLSVVYEKLYRYSKRYILICEYYNPSPVTINYRGHSNRLFKRDFCGEMLKTYKDLRLVDYGFKYHLDPLFPQDDITWFLIEKQ
ncbi:MAG: hypothetical protein J5I59_04520 [Saprospiraceae bacterium]|nr:hypothetical protein [Saprospiraceae bacterium]